MIIRGTTPTETLTINGRDLSDAKVYVTYQQGDVAFTLEGDEVKKTVSDGNTVLSVALTQKDTLSLAPGAVLVQIGWITADGVADKTVIESDTVLDTLYNKEMSYD